MTRKGEFYADYDDVTALYCVFHTETSKAYASYSTMELAEEKAKEMNESHRLLAA